MSITKPPIREKDRLGRERAFKAARIAIEQNLSVPRAASMISNDPKDIPPRTSVQEALNILMFATPEEIAKVESGEIGMSSFRRELMKRVTPEMRVEKGRAGLKTMRPIITADDRQLWESFKSALDALGSMPAPADMVRVVKSHRVRTEVTNQRILPIHAWLEDFLNAWTE